MRGISLILAAGVFSALLGLFAYKATHEPRRDPPPEPLLLDLEGRSHRLADFKGKVLVLNFWATWCQPCRDEMKGFSQLQSSLGDRGLQFVGVAIDDPSMVRAYLRDYPVTYPIWMGGADVPEWSDRLGDDLSALPFTVIFDRAGLQRDARVGLFPPEALLKIVTPLLEEK